MKGQHALVEAFGGWGINVPPAFAYDLFKAEMWKRAKSQGLRRYGKAPSGDDDTRPIGLVYIPAWAGGSWSVRTGNPLVQINNAFYGSSSIYEQTSSKANEPSAYRSAFSVPANTGHSIRAYLYEPPKNQALKLWQIHWGAPGAGVVFQIRNGTPEIGLKSIDFNLNDLATLHTLWAVESPNLSQSQQIEDLLVTLFDSFESLSFENSTAKNDWYNNLWALTFVPEERGAVHIVLEGGDATVIESKTILETRRPGILWDASQIDLFCAGGAFFIQAGYPLFGYQGQLDFGPFRGGNNFLANLGDMSYVLNSHTVNGQSAIEFVQTDYNTVDFGFRATLTAANRRRTPWLYGASARLANGPRNGSTALTWSSDDLYEPASPTTPRYEGQTVLNIVPSFDGNTGKRSLKVTLWNPGGALTAAQGVPRDKVATVSIDSSPLLTNGLVSEPPEEGDMRSLDSQAVQRTSWGSDLYLTISDGWFRLSEVECDPSIIGDGLYLADAFRLLLQVAGFKASEMTGVVPGTGKKLPAAALGEEFACRPDSESKLADAIRTLFDSYGLGWKPYQNRFGIWQMRRIDTTIKGVFTSSGVGLSNLTTSGRKAILKPIDISHGDSGFFNHWIVIGGKNGEIVREMHNWRSILTPGAPDYVGRKKTRKLHNSALVTPNDVNYALRSMEFNNGRGGKHAQYVTFFHTDYEPGDRIQADGGEWEIDGLSGGSWAKDESQWNVMEVV